MNEDYLKKLKEEIRKQEESVKNLESHQNEYNKTVDKVRKLTDIPKQKDIKPEIEVTKAFPIKYNLPENPLPPRKKESRIDFRMIITIIAIICLITLTYYVSKGITEDRFKSNLESICEGSNFTSGNQTCINYCNLTANNSCPTQNINVYNNYTIKLNET